MGAPLGSIQPQPHSEVGAVGAVEEEDALRLGTDCLGDPQPLSHGEGRITWDL